MFYLNLGSKSLQIYRIGINKERRKATEDEDTNSYNSAICVDQSERTKKGQTIQENQTIADENVQEAVNQSASLRPAPLHGSHKRPQREAETGARILLLLQLPLNLSLI